MSGRLLSIGECMVELRQAGAGLFAKGYAGDSFNAAYYARMFLPESWSVDYLSAVGTDRVSDESLDFMRSVGVGTDFVRRIEGRTVGLYMIHLDGGERSFSYWRSASAAKALADDPSHLREAMAASDVIVFSGITLAILSPDALATLLSELGRARSAGKTVVFDPNIRPRLWDEADRMREAISAGAEVATIVMPSFEDETTHFGDGSIEETIRRYRAHGAKSVVVKDGGNGVTIALDDGTSHFVPSAPVAEVVDTTSAGDSFNGAYLAHLARTGDPKAAAAFAAGIAARVISHHGALVERENLLSADA
ncbi:MULTISPECIES: sugar kinase [unclassified Aureimonas]|uniref:sugar kinase n=1 Tax=unclassified Aureimonas TaxID=2615206 RepID=UPI0006F92113|nr:MULTISPECIES: sugar kinase [unclassified Aureimonas]KQT69860.1 2-dehydro-3-deoxygluconokinase [Aureimonas sp. Leaf427]KQT75987.1 2-dehydro-3-deoxygluconokinase [Aureimonas sp. Leaf460]